MLFFAIIPVYPVFILIFYCRKTVDRTDEEFDQKYGSLYEGLKADTRACIFYSFFFLVRRIVMVICVRTYS